MLGQTLGQLAAAQPQARVAAPGVYRLVPTFQPFALPLEAWTAYHQALLYSTEPGTAMGNPDLRYFPPKNTLFSDAAISDLLLYWSIGQVQGVGDVVRLRSQWEVHSGAFLAPHHGVMRQTIPEVTTYVVRYDFHTSTLTGRDSATSGRSSSSVCRTVYIDDVWRAGLGAYVCSPRGLWFRTTGATTAEEIECCRNVDVYHWSQRSEVDTYMPCTPNCQYAWIEGPRGIRVPGIVANTHIRGASGPKGWGPILMADYEPIDRRPSGFTLPLGSAEDNTYMGAQVKLLGLSRQELAMCQNADEIPLEICERLVVLIAERVKEYQKTHFTVPLTKAPLNMQGRPDYVGAVASQAYRAIVHQHGMSLAARQRRPLFSTDGAVLRDAVILADG